MATIREYAPGKYEVRAAFKYQGKKIQANLRPVPRDEEAVSTAMKHFNREAENARKVRNWVCVDDTGRELEGVNVLRFLAGMKPKFPEVKEEKGIETLSALREKYIDHKIKANEIGALEVSSFSDIRKKTNKLIEYTQEGKKKEDRLSVILTPDYLDGFCTAMQERHALSNCSKIFKHILYFLEWHTPGKINDYHITLKKRIKETAKAIQNEEKKKKPEPLRLFTNEEIKKVLAYARKEHRVLYASVLLALNCGFTQKEVATLKHEHISEDIIDRNRNKTGVPAKWKLWTETVEAIKAVSTKPGQYEDDLVFRGKNGLPLVHSTIKDKKESETDAIAQAFAKKKRDCISPNMPPFKHFRKTGASAIYKQTGSNLMLDLYLAHKPHAMKAAYTDEDFQSLYPHTDWLREYFDIEKACREAERACQEPKKQAGSP